jgi:hypothetical protein
MLDRLKKLDVGDITEYERWIKDQRRKELIATVKAVHGDNVPADTVMMIDRELKKIVSILESGKVEVTLEMAQFLVWRSMLKSNPDVTFESAGELLSIDNVNELIDEILPIPDKLPTKKKTVKKKVRKKKPRDN